MPKAGYCRGCNKNVWLKEDGSCQFGHPASSVSNVCEAVPKKYPTWLVVLLLFFLPPVGIILALSQPRWKFSEKLSIIGLATVIGVAMVWGLYIWSPLSVGAVVVMQAFLQGLIEEATGLPANLVGVAQVLILLFLVGVLIGSYFLVTLGEKPGSPQPIKSSPQPREPLPRQRRSLVFKTGVLVLLVFIAVALGYNINKDYLFQKNMNKKVSELDRKVAVMDREISEGEPIKLVYENPRVKVYYGVSRLERIEDKVSNIELFLEDYLS